MYVTSPSARASQLVARTITHDAELGTMVTLAAPSPRYTLADLTVHPSAAATELTIALTHSRAEKATLQVVNLLGTTVAQQAADLRPGANRLPLPVGQLRAGQYC